LPLEVDEVVIVTNLEQVDNQVVLVVVVLLLATSLMVQVQQ
jgi:hypothetical protein